MHFIWKTIYCFQRNELNHLLKLHFSHMLLQSLLLYSCFTDTRLYTRLPGKDQLYSKLKCFSGQMKTAGSKEQRLALKSKLALAQKADLGCLATALLLRLSLFCLHCIKDSFNFCSCNCFVFISQFYKDYKSLHFIDCKHYINLEENLGSGVLIKDNSVSGQKELVINGQTVLTSGLQLPHPYLYPVIFCLYLLSTRSTYHNGKFSGLSATSCFYKIL